MALKRHLYTKASSFSGLAPFEMDFLIRHPLNPNNLRGRTIREMHRRQTSQKQ